MHIPKRSGDPRRRPIRRGALAGAAIALTLVLSGGCSFLGGRPNTVAPAAKLYEDGERLLLTEKYPAAREQFSWLVERFPESELAPVARFLVGLVESSVIDPDLIFETRAVNGWPALVARNRERVVAIINIETDGQKIAVIRNLINPDKLALPTVN